MCGCNNKDGLQMRSRNEWKGRMPGNPGYFRMKSHRIAVLPIVEGFICDERYNRE